MQSACPTLAKALQFSPHNLPWGPPGCGHCRVFLPQKLLGLFRFMSGLLSPSLLSANQRLLLLHSVPCLINTHIPNTFSHTTANTKNLLLHTDNCFKSSSLGEKKDTHIRYICKNSVTVKVKSEESQLKYCSCWPAPSVVMGLKYCWLEPVSNEQVMPYLHVTSAWPPLGTGLNHHQSLSECLFLTHLRIFGL